MVAGMEAEVKKVMEENQASSEKAIEKSKKEAKRLRKSLSGVRDHVKTVKKAAEKVATAARGSSSSSGDGGRGGSAAALLPSGSAQLSLKEILSSCAVDLFGSGGGEGGKRGKGGGISGGAAGAIIDRIKSSKENVAALQANYKKEFDERRKDPSALVHAIMALANSSILLLSFIHSFIHSHVCRTAIQPGAGAAREHSRVLPLPSTDEH